MGHQKWKYCPDCATDKLLTEFPVKSKHTGARRPVCLLCWRERNSHQVRRCMRAKSPAERKAQADGNKAVTAGWRKARRDELRAIVMCYLTGHPCVDCEENDPIVLDFDHRDSTTKLFAISAGIVNHVTPSALLEEIAKCDVRCANCHRRRHAIEQAWYRVG